jgi:hypothetical protein
MKSFFLLIRFGKVYSKKTKLKWERHFLLAITRPYSFYLSFGLYFTLLNFFLILFIPAQWHWSLIKFLTIISMLSITIFHDMMKKKRWFKKQGLFTSWSDFSFSYSKNKQIQMSILKNTFEKLISKIVWLK